VRREFIDVAPLGDQLPYVFNRAGTIVPVGKGSETGELFMDKYVVDFAQLRMTDVEQVGGKNASLGEMISQLAAAGVRVPGGFATTADAYRDFLAQSGLAERINQALDALDVEDVPPRWPRPAREIRQWITDAPLSAAARSWIGAAYEALIAREGPMRCPSRCVRRPPPKTCRMPRSPASRRRS
jgi:hypothetical protein